MTAEVLTSSTTPAGTVPGSATAGRRGRRFDVRRAAAVGLPVATGALLVAATALDPGAGQEGEAMVRTYAQQVDLLQWHAATLHWAYGLWGLIPIALAGLVRGRGRQWANVAAVMGALVVMSMPALMMSDLFFAGLVPHLGVHGTQELGDEIMGNQWAVKSYLLPGLPSMAFCLPVAFIGLARAGRVPKWTPVVAFAGFAAFLVTTGTLVGAIAAAACLVVLSVTVARGTREA